MLVRDLQIHLQNMLDPSETTVGKIYTDSGYTWCTVDEIPQDLHNYEVGVITIEYQQRGIFFKIICGKEK